MVEKAFLSGGLGQATIADWGSHKIHQVCRSASVAEARAAADAEDHLAAAAYVMAELCGNRGGSPNDMVRAIQGAGHGQQKHLR